MYQEDSNEEWRIVMWQIKQLNEPIENKITEWNTGGLLTKIEVGFTCWLRVHTFRVHSIALCWFNLGLQSFYPKAGDGQESE